MKNLDYSLEYCLNILKREVQNLSLNPEEYDKRLVSSLKDYLTIDIASEWEYEHFKYFIDRLLNDKKINQEIVDLFKKIISAFENVSQDIEEIWTLEGFKNHPFWIGQRELANILLEKLNHVII
ncbi:hypothetical protein [Acholeplasma laidlawii]|jgi:hypothetical protein|uniref:hypothetical protein n=1 Tax=Acholeplasma laidlawii TaxID=2148 RepID=UPI003F8F7D80